MKSYIQMSKKAFALSIVLWIVAALLLGISMIGKFSKNTYEVSNALNQKLKSRLEAYDVLEVLKYYIVTADYDSISFKNTSYKNKKYILPDKIILDNRWYKMSKHIKFRIKDGSGLINVSYISPKLFASMVTDEDRQKYKIIDSIKDWQDKDNFTRLNGAEQFQYKYNKKTYKVRNGNFMQSVDELKLINGISSVDNKKWNKLKQKLYYGVSGGTNLCLVDKNSLQSILRLSDSDVDELLEIKKESILKFKKKVYGLKTFDGDYLGFAINKELIIEIVVSYSKARSKLYGIINFRPLKKKAYTIVKLKVL